MNNFRSARDEYVEIENRWRLLSSREARLNLREKEVRQREDEIRRFMTTDTPMQMAPHNQTPIQLPIQVSHLRMPPPPSRQPFKKSRKPKTNGRCEGKDYAQYAVRPDKAMDTTTTTNESP